MEENKPTILIVGTLDTKASELLYLRSSILSDGTCATKILDVGRPRKRADPSIPQDELVPKVADPPSDLPRGEFIGETIKQCIPIVQQLVSSSSIHGIVSAGGSCGTSLATALMRKACPIGFPKLMVSTMASGDCSGYIEESDITMMYSVVDIAGINSILRRILTNAAGSIVGMTTAYHHALHNPDAQLGKRIAVTMFGVTTPCVDAIRSILTSPPHDDYEIYTFHATGSGGRALERLISEGQIDAVIDLTTTEIADELAEPKGILTAGPERLEAALKSGIPCIVSTGACDMVNFGPRSTVPPPYADRNLVEHNPAVTLVRTTATENELIGSTIADKLRTHAKNPAKVKVVLPLGGLSTLDFPGEPFHDPDADEALFEALEDGLDGSEIEVEKYPEHINDEAFAAQLSRIILELMDIDPRKWRLANQRRRRWSFDHAL